MLEATVNLTPACIGLRALTALQVGAPRRVGSAQDPRQAVREPECEPLQTLSRAFCAPPPSERTDRISHLDNALQGQPVLFVHGGPGGGCDGKDAQRFDPEVYRQFQAFFFRSSPPAGLLARLTPPFATRHIQASSWWTSVDQENRCRPPN